MKESISDMIKLKRYIIFIAGVFLMAAAYKCIYDSMGMVTGGFSGIAVIVKYLSRDYFGIEISMWITNTILNVPLFFISYNKVGKIFIKKTAIGTIALTFFIAILPSIKIREKDYLLAAVYGGLICGTGIGLVFRTGSSTGGTDMLAVVLGKKFRHVSPARIMQMIDGGIIVAGFLVFGLNVSLYSLIAVYVTSYITDLVSEGSKNARGVIIISDKYDDISDEIMCKINRGATQLYAKGAYTQKDRKLVFCIVSKKQVPQIREIAYKIDNSSFIAIVDVCEVMGEGFVQNIQ